MGAWQVEVTAEVKTVAEQPGKRGLLVSLSSKSSAPSTLGAESNSHTSKRSGN